MTIVISIVGLSLVLAFMPGLFIGSSSSSSGGGGGGGVVGPHNRAPLP